MMTKTMTRKEFLKALAGMIGVLVLGQFSFQKLTQPSVRPARVNSYGSGSYNGPTH